MAKITAVRTKAVKQDGLLYLTIEYRDGGRVLDTQEHTVADSPTAIQALADDVVKPRLAALAAHAGPLIGDWLAFDTETNQPVAIEPGIPVERAQQYATLFALYAKTGATEAPADYATAIAKVKEWINAASTNSEDVAVRLAAAEERARRLEISIELATLRTAMIENGCSWAEAMSWFAAQQQ